MTNLIKLLFIIIICSININIFSQNEYVELNYITKYITVQNLRVREMPNLNSKVKGFFKIGTPILCSKRTKEKFKIDNFDNYWYSCFSDPCVDSRICGGWFYGEFLSNEKFNEIEYIKKMPQPEALIPKNIKLLNTTWTDCGPGSDCSYGVFSVILTDRTIKVGADIHHETYLIKTIVNKNNEIIVSGTLLLSSGGIKNQNKEKDFIFKINEIQKGVLEYKTSNFAFGVQNNFKLYIEK